MLGFADTCNVDAPAYRLGTFDQVGSSAQRRAVVASFECGEFSCGNLKDPLSGATRSVGSGVLRYEFRPAHILQCGTVKELGNPCAQCLCMSGESSNLLDTSRSARVSKLGRIVDTATRCKLRH